MSSQNPVAAAGAAEAGAIPASSSTVTASDSSKVKGTSNVERRTWDKEEYRKKAQARMAAAEGGAGKKEEFFAVAPAGLKGPAGSKRAFLQARKRKIEVDKNLGKFQTINVQATGAAAGGFYCVVCDCTLRDSVTWIDHINGKKHQKKLGFTMRVERSTVESVSARLNMHKKARLVPKKPKLDLKSYDQAMEDKLKERVAAKKKALEARRAKKKEEEEALAKERPGGGGLDPAMMAMMGFGGFGSTKKR